MNNFRPGATRLTMLASLMAVLGISPFLEPSAPKRRRAYPVPQCSPREVIAAWNEEQHERGLVRRLRRADRAGVRHSLVAAGYSRKKSRRIALNRVPAPV